MITFGKFTVANIEIISALHWIAELQISIQEQ